MTICARCSKTVYFNEEKKAIGKSFHNFCFVCANKECKRRLDTGSLTEHDSEIYCKQCYGRLFGPKGYGYGQTLSMFTGEKCSNEPPTSNIPSTAQAFIAPKKAAPISQSNGSNEKFKFGGADICPRCNKAVYMAEKMMGGGYAWHKSTCFTCKECNKRLDTTTLCERESQIYCKTCYAKLYGPKYYGHGQITAPIEQAAAVMDSSQPI
ncbi:LIM domain protein [Euroglyphus maynei]|uniref:Cysteine-rich protein 1 n=1 Tax=Euroglyphus maynei TaxID=6958 RepID=A0A1Y3BMP2_EURMA|nr:LIM domain protein [Euroglyphus maynei]